MKYSDAKKLFFQGRHSININFSSNNEKINKIIMKYLNFKIVI